MRTSPVAPARRPGRLGRVRPAHIGCHRLVVFFFGLSSLLALYVGTGLHGGRQLGEAALTTMLIAGAAGTITAGRLADRFGRLPVIRASFAVTAAGLAAIVVTGLPWVFGAIALTGFALNQSFSLTVTLGQDYLPTRIGTSSGVTLGLAISIGGLVTPTLGALADATSLHLAVTVLAVSPLAGLALALRLRPPRSGAAAGMPPAAPPCNSAPRL
jgi:MFS transporter, FSR family, fosmidomycin resistance protein